MQVRAWSLEPAWLSVSPVTERGEMQTLAASPRALI